MDRLFSLPGLVMLVGALLYLIAPPPPPIVGPSAAAKYWPLVKVLGLVMFSVGLSVILLRAGQRPLFGP